MAHELIFQIWKQKNNKSSSRKASNHSPRINYTILIRLRKIHYPIKRVSCMYSAIMCPVIMPAVLMVVSMVSSMYITSEENTGHATFDQSVYKAITCIMILEFINEEGSMLNIQTMVKLHWQHVPRVKHQKICNPGIES